MKKLKNKQTSMEVIDGGKVVKATYSDFIKSAINQPPQGGFSPEEMRNRFKVLNAIDGVKPGEDIKLEDAQAEKLKEAVNSYRGFAMVTEEIVGFLDDVEKL